MSSSYRPFVYRAYEEEDLAKLVTLYERCFAEPPWQEVFDSEELATELGGYGRDPQAVLLTVWWETTLVGSVLGFPLSRKPEILELLSHLTDKDAWLPAFYVSEVFVDKNWRRMGIADQLVEQLLKRADAYGYEHGVVRTSVDQPIIQKMFLRKNWRILAGQSVTSTKLVNGVLLEVPDSRIIIGGRI